MFVNVYPDIFAFLKSCKKWQKIGAKMKSGFDEENNWVNSAVTFVVKTLVQIACLLIN